MRKYTIYGHYNEFGLFVSKNITIQIDDKIKEDTPTNITSFATSVLGLDLNIQNTLMLILRIHGKTQIDNTTFTYNLPITL